MLQWWSAMLEKSSSFMPHGHCYLWIPGLLWLNVVSDLMIGTAYLGISLILYLLVRKIRLPFSPVFIAFGLFIALCGLTHFMEVWNIWHPDYWSAGFLKAATAMASVATAVGLVFVKPQVEEVVHAARLSEERRIRLESSNAELESLYAKVKELDEAKTRFFANVSHELRTPLALILGPVERMLGDANLTPEQRRQMESVNRNGKTLLKQVNDLLDVARLDAGKMQVRYARLDLTVWFRRIASQFEIAAEQRAIRYRISAPESLHAQADPDMLERVFINLLSNAFKYTPDGGEIHAELAEDAVGFRFAVTDSGPGVQPDQRRAIFERFRQADDSSTRKHGGSGLGLAIVKEFVDLHHGFIELDTAADGGAVFAVRMPLAAPPGVEIGEAPKTLGATTQAALVGALHELSAHSMDGADGRALKEMPGRPHVLVVEDNPEMRAFVADTLGSEYNVVTASDGQEGFERTQALHPDLIVTDIMMPRMSGDQLVAAVRTQRLFDSVPILLLTAKSDDTLRVKLLQEGAQDYLTKPFLPQELQARARNLVAAKRAGDTLRRELASVSLDLEGLADEIGVKHRQLQTALDATEVAREQAERAGQVKSHFLAMVSHEMRTPLATIDMSLQLLGRENAELAPATLKPRLDRLAKAVRQMNTLIEGLLEYTRVESGRIEARLEAVDARELADEVVEAHRDSVPPDVQLIFAETAARPLPLRSDPHLLRVALSNLVSNALKFTSQGTVTVRIDSAGDGHVFEVHDTGIGIPAEDIPRMFLPFEQLEPIQRKSIPGVGLGLALAKRIVEALHGRLDVTSQVGAGSSFTIWLPRDFPNAAGAAAI